jgi:uncharacterized protein YlxW (UPF0749 family)
MVGATLAPFTPERVRPQVALHRGAGTRTASIDRGGTIMQHRLATLLVAAALAAGCKEKSTADLAKDAQQASGDVADEQKDVRKAEERLEKARQQYQKETHQLEKAENRAGDARSDLAKRAHEDSTARRDSAGRAAPR